MRLKILSIIFAAFLALPARAQDKTASLLQLLEDFNRKNFHEVVDIVKNDQGYYIAGETIYYSLTIKIRPFEEITDQSSIVYVEILDAENRPVVQNKTAIINGSGQGSILLPYTLPTGRYTLVAYAAWMKNFGESCFYKCSLDIYNTFQNLSLSKKSDAVNVRIMPDGGHIIPGVPNRIALHVSDYSGKPLKIKGSFSETIFETDANGISAINLIPQRNAKYQIKLSYNNKDTILELPRVSDAGYTFTITDSANVAHVRLFSSNHSPAGTFHLAVTAGGNLIAVDKASFIQSEASFSIGYSKLVEGVNQFTILDEQNNIICSKRWYVNKTNAVNTKIATDKSIYGKREKVEVVVEGDLLKNIVIDVKRKDGKADVDFANVLDHQSLGYTFKYDVNDINDLLILYGKDNVNWQTVLNPREKLSIIAPELGGHIITGSVINRHTNKPMRDIPIFFSFPGKYVKFYVTNTDSEGKISLEVPLFYGDGDLIVQPRPEDSAALISINSPFFAHAAPKNAVRLDVPILTDKDKAELSLRHKAIQIQHAFHNDSLNRYVKVEGIDTLAFYGKPDESFNLDEYNRFTTVEEVFREYVHTVMVRKHSDGLHLMVLNKGMIVPKYFETDPLVLIDGVPVFNNHIFFAFDPLKLKKGEVIASRYFYNTLKADGIVNLQTYKGDLDGLPLEGNVTVIEYNGLQITKKFYSPDYTLRVSKRIPDYRTELFWMNGANTKQPFSFFTSEVVGQYEVKITGENANGDKVSASSYFVVN
uniref:hypothetical protein n=1 Tax=Pedobacter schmidteae TaxID=2201271 RepID=UPI000EB4FCBB|nr:hypothetical protein [Pedobacter schmidteae]